MAGGYMRWSKYRRLIRRNPNEALWIRLHIGYPALAAAPLNYCPRAAEAMLKRHIQTKVDFIAFRDFNTLDLSSGNLNKKFTTATISAGKSTVQALHVTYHVRFHIVDADQPGDRMAYIDNADYDGEDGKCTSINEVIKSRIAWHREYWAPQGKALRFDAVVRRTTAWVQINTHQWKCTNESLEIFRFPESYTYPPLTAVEKLREEDDLETAEDRAQLAAS